MPLKIPYLLLTFILAALGAVGPFSIDTYLPAFPEIAAALAADKLAVQQTLTAYMGTFAFMVLWHGTLSDAFGRRRVLIVSMLLYTLASMLCASAQSIEWLWIGRGLQGMCGGAGMVVGRAIIRDVLEGPAAQRLMSHVMMMFAVAPAVAPVFGGLLLGVAGWRSIFWFLALFGLALALLCWRALPESLPPEKRQPLHPLALLRAYAAVFSRPSFMALTVAMAFNFCGFFLYVLSAPVFLIEHLGLDAQSFAWLFVPAVAGMILGSMQSGRLAGRWSQPRMIAVGYAVMVVATAINLAVSLWLPPSVPASLLFIPVYTFGMALAMPNLSLIALDLFPLRKGLASSCQGFLQMGANALTAAIAAPLLWGSVLSMAIGSGVFLLGGALLFAGWWRQVHTGRRAAASH